ncbi:MAG: DUF2125 domain-containing protein [Pseudomonadota bacterium]
MARLVFWGLLSVLLYGGYWFGAARAVEQAVVTAAEDMGQDTWQVSYDSFDTSGFPGAFNLRASEVGIVAPYGTWAWQGPELNATAPGFRPSNVTVTLPETQVMRLTGQTLRLDAGRFVIAAATKLNMALSFERMSVDISKGAVQSDQGWRAGLGEGNTFLTKQEGQERTYDLGLNARDLMLPSNLVLQTGFLPETVDQIDLGAKVTLNRELDRFALDGTGSRAMVERIVLRRFDLLWGDIALDAMGSLDVDEDGRPEGRITLRTADWLEVIDALVAVGMIDAGVAPTMTNMASAMVGADGVLELPVTFRDGFMSMGLLPLGPAPLLR